MGVWEEEGCATHGFPFDFPAIYANAFQDLLNFRQETDVEDRARKLNMPKMTWTLRHSLSTSLTLEVPIYSTHSRIHQSTFLRPLTCLIHHFREFYLCHGVRFDFFRG